MKRPTDGGPVGKVKQSIILALVRFRKWTFRCEPSLTLDLALVWAPQTPEVKIYTMLHYEHQLVTHIVCLSFSAGQVVYGRFNQSFLLLQTGKNKQKKNNELKDTKMLCKDEGNCRVVGYFSIKSSL